MSKIKFSIIADESVTDNKAGYLGTVDEVIEGDLSYFTAALTEFHICAGVFKDNVRRKSQLEGIRFIQFDFDSGFSVESAIARLGKKFSYVIAGSKNHMKDKGDGKGVIPRFHVFIPLSVAIRDCDYYSFFISQLGDMLAFPYDRACKDATRYFFKHSSIIHTQDTGDFFPTGYYQNAYERMLSDRKKAEARAKRKAEKMTKAGVSVLEQLKKTKAYKRVMDGELRMDGFRNALFLSFLGTAKTIGVDKYTALQIVYDNSTWGESYTKRQVDSFANRIWSN